ncbi:MAG: metallophosphoesterase [Flavobacteriaceae bacterium]|nr:metallophosphoesterase [Flavobacteriaceae bacterium]
MNSPKYLSIIITVLLLTNCATYKPQYKNNNPISNTSATKDIAHSFYLLGDGGNSPIGSETITLKRVRTALTAASKNSTLLFLGDNIYPAGMPKKGHTQRNFAEHQLNIQTDIVKNFKGNTIFIPGNHDWYANGLKGLERQENYIKKILGKNSFLPKNGCPIDKVDISNDIVLITIDSEWYLTNWDKHPTINDDCEIKTRSRFFDEFEGLVKKARGKTTIIAMHHPMYTNGPHGGQFSLQQQLFPTGGSIPLPILGTFINILRKTSGLSNTDLQNKRYLEFKNRIVTLSQENAKVIFVAGHEHSLQYIVKDNLPQIVSGSGSKVNPTRNIGGGLFSAGIPGYARLDIYKDGSSDVTFIASEENKILFQTQVLKPNQVELNQEYPTNSDQYTFASIYTKEEITKGKFYKYLWGKRYRKQYGTKVKAKNVHLDTLFGGLKPIRKGGGHQSKSLRLEDKEGREYVMRALRKNALQYLQAVAFKTQYIEGQFDGTYSEGLLLDVFTGSHPYAPFTVATLANAIGVLHTKPQLFYVPKQKTLAHFNEEFGDELYMIEERAASGHGDKANFGYANKVISTNDVLKKIRKNANSIIDESAYIRARLFDMVLGDWDRHEDQWRWAAFKENNKTIYRPFPRDRDQVFSIMADGALLNYITKSVPSLRLMQSYEEEMGNTKWFNLEPYPLDMAIITEAKKTTWDTEVLFIQKNITDQIIDEALRYFPSEVTDQAVADIKRKLKGRVRNLQKISNEYFEHMNNFAVIRGTDKDDYFEIERLANGITQVTGYRIKKGKKDDIFHQKKYNANATKEIWIYGLDDKDEFKVFGAYSKGSFVRIIGGQNNDIYNILNGHKVKVYDYKSKKNTFLTNKGRKKLTDSYTTNVYDYKKLKYSSTEVFPTFGVNPDDGLKLGLLGVFTNYGFDRNPFTSQYSLATSYYFATEGFDIKFTSEFANVIGNWNFGLEAEFTSPNYSVNFFGFGNETVNPNFIDENTYNEDYNRVKLRKNSIAPYFIWRGKLGGNFKIGASYESIEVDNTNGRYIATSSLTNKNTFLGAEAHYNFENQDNKAFPTLGMKVDITVGYKSNTESNTSFGYLIPALSFNYKLVTNGQLVLATKIKSHLNFGNGFEFYQGASIGAHDGLRGYRNQRFTGKNSFYQSTDIRLNLRKIKTGLLPLHIGIYGGYDYGRVWLEHDLTNNWNSSFGGGVFLNAADMISANLGVFKGDEYARVAFSLGFSF